MFKDCVNLVVLKDISNWDTKNIIDREDIFDNCLSLLSVPDNIDSDIIDLPLHASNNSDEF